jgi:hypothetical protein
VLFAAVVACACSWGGRAAGDVITAQSFRLEIATNMVWMENKNDPTVQILVAQQNFFDRQVANSNPCLRITNLSDHSRIVAAQLNLENSAAKISSVEWLETPGEARWQWDASNNHAMFDFIDPILPGKSISMRLTTAANGAGYVMDQNLFRPVFVMDGTKAQYGIVTLSVQESTSSQRVQFDSFGDPVGPTYEPAPMYDLANPIETPLLTYGTPTKTYGVEAIVTIQPVPEPETLAMAGTAAAMLGLWGLAGRRRSGALGKA